MREVLSDFYRYPAGLLGEAFGGDGRQPFRASGAGNRDRPCNPETHWKAHLTEDISDPVSFFRYERYADDARREGGERWMAAKSVRRLYYLARPLLPDCVRRRLQRLYLADWDKLSFPQWPVDTTVETLLEAQLVSAMETRGLAKVPFVWFWPDGAQAAAIVTHDVETSQGVEFIPELMDFDDAFDVKSSYQLVPEERYAVPERLLAAIREQGCEVNVHGLNHEGDLFRNRELFSRKAKQINRYVQAFGADGFRAECMYRNADWLEELDIQYDMSVPNVAHLEPQRGGCCTVFPYFIGRILELPLTTIQDYSLFHMLCDYSMNLWRQQTAAIMQRHGLISVLTHPDYLLTKRAQGVYGDLLRHLSHLREEEGLWITSPGEVNRWWRQRHEMKLVFQEGDWKVVGPGSERACVAYVDIEETESLAAQVDHANTH